MTTLPRSIAVLASVAALWATPSMIGDARGGSAAAPERSSIAQTYREVTVPAGTRLRMRLASSYSSASSRREDRVDATLASPVRAGGLTALPGGSRISGVVSSVARPGKVKGRGVVGLRLTQIMVGGESYPITASYTRVAPATKGEDAGKIAIPAVGGAVIGGLIGGKKGAITGAAVGGGAGTAVVLSTRGKDATIRGGSVITVTLRRPLRVRVPIQ